MSEPIWRRNISYALPIISGSLSLMGSMTIVYMILWPRKKQKIGRRYQHKERLSTTYDRLLFGMSVMDIFGSSAVVLSTLPSPKEDTDMSNWIRYGTTSTCTAQGFFYYVGMNGTTLYYCVLCVYYAIIIKSNSVKNKTTEILLHSIPIVYCLTSGIYLAATQHFNNAGSVCWIAEYPRTCREDRTTCERGANGSLYRVIFTGTVIIGSFVIILICMIILTCTVRKQERKMQQYDFAKRNHYNSRSNRDLLRQNSSFDTSDCLEEPSSKHHRLSMRIFSSFSPPSVARRRVYSSATTRKMQRTNEQGRLYILAYFITFIFGIINQFCIIAGNYYYPLIFLQQATAPLQGFLNFLVYIRPQVLKVRRLKPEISWCGAFVESITASDDSKRQQEARLRPDILIRNNGVRNIDTNNNSIRSSNLRRSKRRTVSTLQYNTRRCSYRRDNVPTLVEENAAICMQNLDYEQGLTTLSGDDTNNLFMMNSIDDVQSSIGSIHTSDDEEEIEDALVREENQNNIIEKESNKCSIESSLDLEHVKALAASKFEDNNVDESVNKCKISNKIDEDSIIQPVIVSHVQKSFENIFEDEKIICAIKRRPKSVLEDNECDKD